MTIRFKMDSGLNIAVNKKACAFIMHIGDPNATLRTLSMFFLDRKIPIDNLNLHRYLNGEAMVIIHCQIEKDRISRTMELLENLPGIMTLEKLQEK